MAHLARPAHIRVGPPFGLNASPVPPLAISDDSKEFATRLQPLQVGLFSVASLKRDAAFTVPMKPAPPGSAISALAWSPRDPLVAVASSDGTLGLWNVAHKPRLLRTLRGSPKPKAPFLASGVAFSPDGTHMLEWGFVPTSQTAYDGVAAMWRVSDGKLLWREVHPGWSTDAAAISDDGRTVALAQFLPSNQTDRTQLVNAGTGAVERTVHQPGDVLTLGFSPDGRLETGNYLGIVRSWDVRTGKELGRPLLAMPAPVSSLAFQPGTDVFATGGGSGGFVKLWDAKTLAQIGSALPGSPGLWANGVFTPDGSHIVTIYEDGRGAVWPVTLAAWMARACNVAGRNFTRDEWQRFVGGRTYSTVCPKP